VASSYTPPFAYQTYPKLGSDVEKPVDKIIQGQTLDKWIMENGDCFAVPKLNFV